LAVAVFLQIDCVERYSVGFPNDDLTLDLLSLSRMQKRSAAASENFAKSTERVFCFYKLLSIISAVDVKI